MTDCYEISLEKTGWGICSYFLVGLCSVCSFVEAVTSLIVFIVTPILICDLNLSKSNVFLINALQSLGMAIGAFLFGSLADLRGRKGTISVTMVIVFCASIALAFTQTTFLIYIFTFLLGLGVAGNNVVLRVYLIEWLPIKKREICIAILDLLWILGCLFALSISQLLIPSTLKMFYKKFRPNSWRVLATAGGTPALMIACAIGLLPPSPRYLLYRRNREEALVMLQQMYAINNSQHTATYTADNIELCIEPAEDIENENIQDFITKTYKYFLITWKRISKIFRPSMRRTTMCSTLICLLHFPGFIWLALWNTHILQEFEVNTENKQQQENFSCNVNIEHLAGNFLFNCQKVHDEQIQHLLLLSLSYILGEVLLISSIHIIGKRTLIISSGFIGGLALLGVFFTIQNSFHIILSAIFLTMYAVNYTTVTSLILENYPTSLRGTIMGFTKIFPHLAASMTKLILKVPCNTSIIAISTMLISAAIVVIPLPDLTGAPMQE